MDNSTANFDEAWCLKRYPDVKEGVLTGRIKSAWHHYQKHGASEGRQPRRAEYDRVFAFGAYGTNNVGDEAIYYGIKQAYPSCIQIYVNNSLVKNSVWYYDAIEKDNFFEPGDLLILGGGGLLYERSAVNDMIRLAQKARASNAAVHILGLGCEAAKEEYYAEIRELVELAQFTTVRTTRSQNILEAICGKKFQTQDDFAYNLKPLIPPSAGSIGKNIRIGVVTGGDSLVNYSELVKAIRSVTVALQPKHRYVEFLHMPHSMAFGSKANNDLTVGHALWSSVGMESPNVEPFFSVDEFTADPFKRLRRYQELDGVISARFHGLIFSEIVQIPALALWGAKIKNKSLIEDRSRPGLFVSQDDKDLRENFDNFIRYVAEDKKNRRNYMRQYEPAVFS